nr:hypothetical protein BaRGS_015782 [Batillaria attramentaria]
MHGDATDRRDMESHIIQRLGSQAPGAPPSVTSLTLTTSSQDSVPGPFSLYSPVDVICPPEFDKESVNEVSVAPNNTNSAADVKFKVRTHTKTITKCKLTSFAMRGKKSKMASNPETKDSSQNAKDCKSSSTLTGTPPDLTLTVRLDNVRKEEEGQWRLELTNDVGTGYVDFPLKVEGAGPDGYLQPVIPRSRKGDNRPGSYEHPAMPDYESTSTAYEQLRHVPRAEPQTADEDVITIVVPAVVAILVIAILVIAVVIIVIFLRRRRRFELAEG